MDKFVILADVTCDLNEEVRRFIGMEDYIRGHAHINDGKRGTDIITTLDWTETDRGEFYKSFRIKNIIFQPLPQILRNMPWYLKNT